jgi:adenosylhomocysteine nucleosidase
MRDPDAKRLAPAPVPADVGIVMALSIEAGYLSDSLEKVRKYSARSHAVIEGELAGKLVAIVLSGVGHKAARAGAEVLIAGHRPRWLLSAGFAGALDPALRRNDLVLPDEVVGPGGGSLAIDCPVDEITGFRRPGGRLLTVDRVVVRAADKAELRRESSADLLDMETFAVAQAARERAIRFLGVRVISDDACSELPSEVARLLSQSGSYRVGAAMRAIWDRPSALKDFWTLHARALEAADRLARGIAKLLKVLPVFY